jgi:hypothetical protein
VEPDITPACVQVEVSEKSTGSADDVINASSTLYQHTDMSVGTHVNSIATLLYDDTQNSADTNHAASVLYDSHNNTDGNSHAANVLYDQFSSAARTR